MNLASQALVSPTSPAPNAHVQQPKAVFWGLVPCAGQGLRALEVSKSHTSQRPDQLDQPDHPVHRKQYQPIAGLAMVLHTLAAFAGVERLRGTLVAISAGDAFFDSHASAGSFAVPCGGATRADTVRGGLRALQERGASDADWVLVHDAARCLVTTAQINALIDACSVDGVGGLLAHKLADTLKSASAGPGGIRVIATLDRSDKWLAQTPQMFRLGRLAQALEQFGSTATDESSAMEALGERPKLVPGSALNFKVTYPEDFALAEAVLLQRMHAGTLARFGGAAQIRVATQDAVPSPGGTP